MSKPQKGSGLDFWTTTAQLLKAPDKPLLYKPLPQNTSKIGKGATGFVNEFTNIVGLLFNTLFGNRSGAADNEYNIKHPLGLTADQKKYNDAQMSNYNQQVNNINEENRNRVAQAGAQTAANAINAGRNEEA